ncbi:hypothetical protein ES703_76478 [subsurface metagenome]
MAEQAAAGEVIEPGNVADNPPRVAQGVRRRPDPGNSSPLEKPLYDYLDHAVGEGPAVAPAKHWLVRALACR